MTSDPESRRRPEDEPEGGDPGRDPETERREPPPNPFPPAGSAPPPPGVGAPQEHPWEGADPYPSPTGAGPRGLPHERTPRDPDRARQGWGKDPRPRAADEPDEDARSADER